MIPLPFLDDYTRDVLRRRLARRLASEAGLDFHGMEIAALSGTLNTKRQGCFRRILVGGVFYVIKRFLRKLMIVFMVKDSVETVTETFYDAYLVRHGLSLGAGRDPGPVELRAMVEEVLATADTQPVKKLVRESFHGSWWILRKAARQLGRLVRPLWRRRKELDETPETQLQLEEQEQELASLVDQISDRLAREGAHLAQLESRLKERLGGPKQV